MFPGDTAALRIGMAEVADGNILPDGELEIAATRGQDERTFYRWRPDQIAVDDTLDVVPGRG